MSTTGGSGGFYSCLNNEDFIFDFDFMVFESEFGSEFRINSGFEYNYILILKIIFP